MKKLLLSPTMTVPYCTVLYSTYDVMSALQEGTAPQARSAQKGFTKCTRTRVLQGKNPCLSERPYKFTISVFGYFLPAASECVWLLRAWRRESLLEVFSQKALTQLLHQ